LRGRREGGREGEFLVKRWRRRRHAYKYDKDDTMTKRQDWILKTRPAADTTT